MSLPKGYVRLEYLQSSGTQYVNTGVSASSGFVVEMEFIPVSFDGYYDTLIGTESSASPWNCNWVRFNENYWELGVYDAFSNTEPPTVGTRYKIVASTVKGSGYLKVNGTQIITQNNSNGRASTSLYLFANNKAGTATDHAPVKCYSCKITVGGSLVRDYVPMKRISDNALGLYDLVNDKFYTNAGTGTFTAGPVIVEPLDESKVVELEYIESNGAQYVSVGLKPNQNTRVRMDAYMTQEVFPSVFFGCRPSSYNKNFALFINSSVVQSTYNASTAKVTGADVYVRSVLDANKNTVQAGGASATHTAGTFQTDFELFLFASNEAGTAKYFAYVRAYACQIFDNGLLARDYIPAKTVEGEIGLYDRVFKEFYRNAGTGAFVAGPEMVHVDYTELEWVQGSGSQYIDSLYKPSGILAMRARVYQPSENAGTEQAVFGSSDTTNGIELAFSATKNRVVLYSSAAAAYVSPTSVYDTVFDLAGFMQDVAPNRTLRVSLDGGAEVTSTGANASGWRNHTISLFALNKGYFFKGRMYEAQIYDNGTEVRVYVPKLHPSGVAGLWDSVNERFYASASTADFIAGPVKLTTPKAPANFRVVSESDTEVALAWDAAEKAEGYRVYRDGALLADTTDLTYTDPAEPFGAYTYTVRAYNEFGEGEAAELVVILFPDNPLLWLVTDRTAQDVAEQNSKGVYTAVDLNRVGAAVDLLKNLLESAGFIVNVFPKLMWKDTEWMNASQAEQYLADIQTLRTKQAVLPTTPETPETMARLNYTGANHIEQILLDVYTQYLIMLTTRVAAGTATSGGDYL